jgi:histone H3/H4
MGSDGASLGLNDWSFTQLCDLARVSRDTVNRVSADTARRVLEETLPEGKKPFQLFTEEGLIRSIHGTHYTRLYNADLVTMLSEFATDFTPPQKAVGGGTGLYCGEQDLFVFLIDPTGWAEIDGQAFAPGFFVWNSEVGKRSVGIQTFWFQAVCQNHIVWDATEVVEFTRKHTGKVGEALSDIRRIVEQLVEKRDARKDGFVAVMRKAMEEKLGDDAEDAMKALTKAGITKTLAKRAIEVAAGQGRFTIFALVEALTRIARELPNAGERTDADQKAAGLLALVN